ncbi:hypothetical protein ACX80X_18035 [Pseudarthrobacter sp. MDT3-1]
MVNADNLVSIELHRRRNVTEVARATVPHHHIHGRAGPSDVCRGARNAIATDHARR